MRNALPLFLASALLATTAHGAAAAGAPPPAPAQTGVGHAAGVFKSAVLVEAKTSAWIFDLPQTREALVYVRIVISPHGKVTKATIEEDMGFYTPDFADGALDVARSLTFKPATLDGKPVEQTTLMPVTFGKGGTGVTPEFMTEARKVSDLLKSGDYAGADFHAQWMMKEKVRHGYEFAVLKLTLAQTHASLGHDHEALAYAEEATQRTSMKIGEFSLHQAIPPNSPGNYMLPKDLVIGLLDLRMRLAARNGMPRKALMAYYELAGLETMAPDDPRVAQAAEFTARLESDEPLTANIVLLKRGWRHALSRHRFTLEHMSGNIDSITLRCGDTSRSLPYIPGEEWTVPDGSRDCTLGFIGEPGTKFQLVEPAD